MTPSRVGARSRWRVTKVDSIAELRRRVQAPVAKYNDVAGQLFGDWASIHVTRLFIRFGWSPTLATVGFLVLGVVGSVLTAFGGAWSVAGFACLIGYYVLDCVDGEVARFHGTEKLIWGFHDFMFHLYVKAAFYLSLGFHAAKCTGREWAFLLGIAALLATLLGKFLYDAVLVLNARYVLLRERHERERLVEQLTHGTSSAELDVDADLPGEFAPFRIGGPLSALRAVTTNFDLGLLLFFAAAILDLFVEPFAIRGVTCDLKTILVAFYGVVLPLDFVDRMVSYVRADRFQADSRRLLRRAHGFRIHRD